MIRKQRELDEYGNPQSQGEEVLNTNAEAPTTPEDHGADEMELVENDDSS